MERLQEWEQWLNTFLDYPLLKLGGATISLWTFVYFMVLLVLLFIVAGKLRKWLVLRVLVKTKLDLGARQAIGSITRYLAILIGLLVALQTVGIDLTTLNVVAGAVGIGVGFGLQNIANNFISGLIILFERPIKIGDRIEVGGVDGDVVEIGARSTTVLTNDKISIIIPNSKFITDNVTNWSHTDPRVRFHMKVGVAYGSDVREVEKLLIEVARANPNVISDPPPKVWFRGFGDSSLDFELLAWNTNLVHSKGQFISDLNFAIYEKFKKHGIEIPFPQRDLHIRSGGLPTNTNHDRMEHEPPFVVQKIET
ncbi:MAG: mechanosensitive ion channel family protein [Acidobacteria bacterium]|nr:mechanosensitive ion channel family protein [Acidobacteriota bacterium]